ncbi:hypothetical protein BN946_scf184891.g1 [Trametes cinnabarina]|uniref:Uncharacterized protein n=1 Tax=Pycnoporus cinnabarinus TaxID=5643 RepID=A0A060SU96_PYCCI|nr:hypothetical protein BN946_scf184891.g1 [Trametes cinnabarina]
MPRSRRSRRNHHHNPQYQNPARQQTQPHISDQQLLDQLIPDLSTILGQSPTYDHLPRLPTSSFGNGTFTDRVGWTLVHPDLRCAVNQLLGLRVVGLSAWADVYRSAADIVPALHLMRTFTLAHPGTDHDFHREVRAVLDTSLIRTHQLADLSLGKIVYQVLDYPAFHAILPKPPYVTTTQPNPAYDGPGRVDCLPGALRHREEQAWDNLISTHAPLTSPNTANQQWGLPSVNSAHWGVSPTPWDGSDDKASNGDSDKENGCPDTPHPQVQAQPTTPTPSLPELQEDDEADDSISEEAGQYLRNFLFGLTRTTPLTTPTNALDVLATVASAERGILTTPYLDDVVMTVNPNDLHLPMEGQV